ncbi:hypothetical protein AB0M35_12145 [Micromonospora sp. NPDC051196]|uniref:hypothetical protein n=1 Tax=Micromonospora sp. NPDC051196 TaxID=3155281 RepID=UPI00341EB8AE
MHPLAGVLATAVAAVLTGARSAAAGRGVGEQCSSRSGRQWSGENGSAEIGVNK